MRSSVDEADSIHAVLSNQFGNQRRLRRQTFNKVPRAVGASPSGEALELEESVDLSG